MDISVLSIFPKMFDALNESVIGKAQEKGLLNLQVVDFRDFTTDKQNHVDDAPYGGGAGMLLQAQPIYDAMSYLDNENPGKKRVILLDPAGKTFDAKMAQSFAKEDHLVFICGHYEGFDERIKDLVTDEVSIGDYVLTGGELPTMSMIDATMRFVPGVLGNNVSADEDSFSHGLLEYPQYTRPADFRGKKVPEVLTSGNHEKIRVWRLKQALKKTLERRPDLLKTIELNDEEKKLLREIRSEM
ncbi:tRNA (guanosine(37)-N1)-methyltransferase TrmD [Companilactobacillus sp.]|jgi:tRNA (guanine37-N1)-methyltransferase|uniref:tRNA (guanosine(37)-N1)-methyltransferase TrmD n=1 Tax=Companilactobacillus sp. TaxID=2767905 RepID=UPI0025BC555B|nr:tRNA (guanosine(37)-N1)-methyltransferase TrmD [Companilactobacillus sp.]MCH4008056.1 tRNA (guanosine(37)-N1)-methyltransferase TrmD [Companilactobacillus sp.]MCH4051765.1 tRNA (guanosine(37)-N1)-methyltransferase TrmD [Companilactobacillus sp.]MCH4075999.1 tRNA (guanosine(37)-N1)-methyltransferase TrmD [Companilactobacillus sp.]MCH4124574.1 tRNA (guanosine(37)-N1)-methyltransferase TrmD [Companilactobacillus sp.]MCH4132463.1 tRNA (guanosine(37)-N1)-methyltransferase TrmD [Companilactobacil